MKIHLFKNKPGPNSRNLTNVIQQVNGSDLSDRNRIVDGKIVFMERCEENKDEFGNVFYRMDFTLRRVNNGPGHSVPGEETEDFKLDKEDGFAEQTMVVYSPRKEYLAIQYNHYGVRAGSIAKYFGMCCETENDYFNWEPVPDDAVKQKLHRSVVRTKIDYKIDMSSVTKESAKELGLIHAFDLSKQHDAGTVQVIVSYGNRKRGGPLQDMMGWYSRIVSRLGDDVKRMKVDVKNDDSVTECLDLLRHRLVQEVDDRYLKKTSFSV